jgi:hypothetical protein
VCPILDRIIPENAEVWSLVHLVSFMLLLLLLLLLLLWPPQCCCCWPGM